MLTRPLGLIALLVALVMSPPVAHAASLFVDGPESSIDTQAQAWHSGYEKAGDYSESWFFLTQTADGGVLFAVVFITNLGMHTYDAGYDVAYYAADGRTASCHKEYRRSAIRSSVTKMDTSVGRARVWRDDRGFHLGIDEPEMNLALTLVPTLPSHQFGNGRLTFDDGKIWAQGMNAPRAQARGKLTSKTLTADLTGIGYHDHNWTTVKIPSMLARWRTLRVFSPRVTLVLHDQLLSKRYGGKPVRFGILAYDDTLVASLRDFAYTPTKTRRDVASGYDYPTAYRVEAKGGGYTVQGTVVERRLLESVDVLAQLSWPVRAAIRTFYAKPFTLRYVGEYELSVTTPDGQTSQITGEAPMEANFY